MQYTLRNISPALDAALRSKAKEDGKSLNQAAIEVLEEGLGVTPRPRRDLSYLVGSWVEEPEVQDALQDQRRIDDDLWR